MEMRRVFLKGKNISLELIYTFSSCDSFKNMKEAKQSSWQISGKYNTQYYCFPPISPKSDAKIPGRPWGQTLQQLRWHAKG